MIIILINDYKMKKQYGTYSFIVFYTQCTFKLQTKTISNLSVHWVFTVGFHQLWQLFGFFWNAISRWRYFWTFLPRRSIRWSLWPSRRTCQVPRVRSSFDVDLQGSLVAWTKLQTMDVNPCPLYILAINRLFYIFC